MKPILFLAAAAAILATQSDLGAQTFSVLHQFSGPDGSLPVTGLLVLDGTLYGTTSQGGAEGSGTVFSINPDGTGFTELFSFDGKSEGAGPFGGLVSSSNILYGTARGAGALPDSTFGFGTVFKIDPVSGGFSRMYTFTGLSDGSSPWCNLVLSGGTLYGTTYYGGTNSNGATDGNGVVFKINTDGTGFAALYAFQGWEDGRNPQGGLIVAGETLYGTTSSQGVNGQGTVFKINTDGTGFTVLYSFNFDTEGASPMSGLTLSGNTLYGTTYSGGKGGAGAVFKINTDGTGFTTLHSFVAPVERGYPASTLVLSGETLYGTTEDSTVFKINTDGTGFATLYTFTDGGHPTAGVVLSENTLYGTTEFGGTNVVGSVFALRLPAIPVPIWINLQPDLRSVVLSWTNAAFFLQTAPGIGGVFTNIPGATSPYTNAILGTQQYFRLIAN